MKFTSILWIFLVIKTSLTLKTCVRKNFDNPEPAMVCVCNSTYCDELPPLGQLNSYQAAVYETSIAGKRFERSDVNFTDFKIPSSETVGIILDDSVQYQKIIGFGGAFTDSVGINLKTLSAGAQQNLLEAYFGQEGIGYTVGRVPMASCDFSLHEYSYADVPEDFDLVYFNLTSEDFDYKIPFINTAKNLAGPQFRLFASPWSAPGWMKTNGRMYIGNINGRLKGDVDGPYYKTWANYFVRFFEEYAKQNITFWGVTAQNEPLGGVASNWQAMFFTAEIQRDFIKGYLGPALRSNDVTKDLFLMILDDQRPFLPYWADVVLNDPESAKYVDGIAVHWYEDELFEAKDTLWETHKRHPDVPMFATEACNGYLPFPLIEGPLIGDWNRAVSYASDIIDDLQNWVGGWTDWNICLDLQGGPTWVKNYVDAPILINKTSDEFYKQPMYYALGHFSKFIVPNSTRVFLNLYADRKDLSGVGFITPETSQRVVVLQNRNETSEIKVQIRDKNMMNEALNLVIDPRSIVTIVWDKVGN